MKRAKASKRKGRYRNWQGDPTRKSVTADPELLAQEQEAYRQRWRTHGAEPVATTCIGGDVDDIC